MNAGLQGDDLKQQLERLGYSSADLETPGAPAVYAENAREETRNALKGRLVRESLTYGLACAETAFVAVRTEAGERVSGSVIVPSALPAGWSDPFLTRAAAPGVGVSMALAAAPPPSAAGEPKGAGAGLLHRILSRDTRRSLSAVRDSDLASIAPTPDRPATRPPVVQFTGRPTFEQAQAVLIEETMAQDTTLSRIAVELDVPAGQLDRGLALWVYVQDLAVPRARIRLADLMRLGGKRPLNLAVRGGEVVRIVLVDPKGAWAAGAPSIAVRIAG
jgi:Ca-activated chloride channel family protein